MIKKKGNFWSRIEWVNTGFLAGAHVLAFGGLWVLWALDRIHPATVGLAVVMSILTGLAITGGYHRLFSHRAYSANWLVKLAYLCFGAAAYQNSAWKWSSDHRRHHKFVDTEKDPYNIKEGFLFAHMGWILLKYDQTHSYEDVPDLINDPLVKWQDKHYLFLSAGFGLLLPTLVAALWGDPLGGFFIAGWLRIVANEHFTFSINSFVHLFGTQPYSDADTSRDNWFFAFFTFGEGYHNFHHKFPFDYRNGIRSFHWDPTKWLISLLSRIGWATELKRTPDLAILKARLSMDEKRVLRRMTMPGDWGKNMTEDLVKTAREKLEVAFSNLQKAKKDWESFPAHLTYWNDRLDQIKLELAAKHEAFKEAASEWIELCSGFNITPTRATV